MLLQVRNCLEGNTMSNRGAYSTKERMPSDRRLSQSLSAWKAVPDWLSYTTFRDVLPSRQYKCYGLIPAHPRFTRMYGVTHGIAFQAILYLRTHVDHHEYHINDALIPSDNPLIIPLAPTYGNIFFPYI